MQRWLKYNVSQQTYKPISVNQTVSNKRDIVHNNLLDKARRKMILHEKDSDGNLIFMRQITDKDYIINNSDSCILGENIIPSSLNYIILSECDIEDIASPEANIDNIYYCDLSEWKFIEKYNPNATYKDAPTLICVRRDLKEHLTDDMYKKYEISLERYWDNEYATAHSDNSIYNSISNTVLGDYPFNEIIEYNYVSEQATLENRVEQKTRKVGFDRISTDDVINIKYKG